MKSVHRMMRALTYLGVAIVFEMLTYLDAMTAARARQLESRPVAR